VSENDVKTDWKTNFSLDKKYRTRDEFINFNDVEFTSKIQNDMKYLVGFDIIIKNSTKKDAIIHSDKKALNITSLLSLDYGKILTFKRTNTYRLDAKLISVLKTVTLKHGIGDWEPNLNPIDHDMLSSLEKNPVLAQQFIHVVFSMQSIDVGRFDMAIIQLYMATDDYCENGDFDEELKKYRWLRHILAHSNIRKGTAKNVQKYFPDKFDYNGNDLNRYSAKTTQDLKSESEKLLNLTRRYLKKKLLS